METVGRLLAGILPWLESESGNRRKNGFGLNTGRKPCKQLQLLSIPVHRTFLYDHMEPQMLVDAAFLAYVFYVPRNGCGTHYPATKSKEYLAVAEMQLRSLSSPAYRANLGKNGNFILKHSVGHMPNKTEVDVPLTYADYYYVEALTRMKKLLQ